MSRIKRSSSSTFLMELLFNLFLFCLLCSCGLLFFSKSHNMTKDTTALHQAVSLASSVASIYESGDGSLDALKSIYPCENTSVDSVKDSVTIYLSDDFEVCSKAQANYYLTAELYYDGYKSRSLEIMVQKINTDLVYKLTTNFHSQTTLGELREVQHEDAD